MPEKLEKATSTITGHFEFSFGKKNWGRDVIVFKKLRFKNVVCPLIKKRKPAFSKS